MTRLPIRFGLPVAALLLIGATGCAGADPSGAAADAAAPNPGTIGIAMPTRGEQRWIADGDNMVKQFQALGYGVDMKYADNDAQQQAAQLDEMIDRGDRALVIGAVDGTVLADALQRAHAKDIPIISYDRLIRGSADVDYYASFDNFKVGVLQATTIVNRLGLRSAGKAHTIELFAGSADDNNATFFFNGAMSVLRPYLKAGTLVVPSGQTTFAQAATAKWEGANAAARMKKLLTGERLDAVLAPNDGIARALIGALREAGYGKLPVITGQDAELDSVKLVDQGVQTQTVYKDTRELAKVAVQMTDKVLSGEKPEINDTTTYDNGEEVVPAFLLQPVSVEKANLRSVLIDGGYYSEGDLA
ncbi:multiple monosaccharide ABC transporter substrate-binding protein [Paractinoplanes rhizophilus]|uniref:Multiple monosaccharide ABC transporter substrate-binding protein n=1 Tax=Paractinoplanes rhizophilus TaxID=1416877 RepID=A0ABW2I033_9ACTN